MSAAARCTARAPAVAPERRVLAMRRRTMLALSVAVALPVAAAEGAAMDAGRQAAADWLRLIDAADHAGAWAAAASGFRRAVTRQAWVQASGGVRSPLGRVLERLERSARFARSLPGAPDGEYIVLQYQTTFEHKAKAVETVTVVRDTDGRWRVTGYFIN